MSRLGLATGAIIAMTSHPATLFAQDLMEPEDAPPDRRLDLSIDTQSETDGYEDCRTDQDAAAISGEIVVCRRATGEEHRLYDREEAQRRHAERTAYINDPEAPDFILDCHEQGWPVGCAKMGRAPPPTVMIDVTALPEAPPGSDAERIGQGLAPVGENAPVQPEIEPDE